MPQIQINDISMYYEVHGEGAPVLLLHGLGSSTKDWEYQVPALSKDYKVYTVDCRGHGQSEKPKGKYTIPLFTNDVIAFVEKMGLTDLNIIGLSMGGMMAFQFVTDRPDLIKSVVILNSGPEFKIKTFKQSMMVWQRKIIMKTMGLPAMSKVLAKRLFPEKGQEEVREIFYQRWITNDKDAYYRSFLALINWGVKEKLPEIKCPVLVLTADMDYTPVAYKEEYTKLIPKGKVQVIKNSRHTTPFDQPEQLNVALSDFLKEVVNG